jgi:hypothetical protein
VAIRPRQDTAEYNQNMYETIDVGREYDNRHADVKGCCPSRIRSGDDAVGIQPTRGVGGERSERGCGQRESHMF